MVIASSGEARAAARPYARSAAVPLERAWESLSLPALTLGPSISRVQGAAPTSSSQHLGEHWCHMLASLGAAECSGQFLARCPRTFHPMDELRRSQRRQHRTRGWLQGLHSCGARGASVQLEKTQPISSSSFQLDQVCSRNVRTQCLACTNGADLLVCVLGQAWSRGLLALLLSRCHPRLDWVRAPVELSHPLASELGGATCSRSSASGGATSGGATSGGAASGMCAGSLIPSPLPPPPSPAASVSVVAPPSSPSPPSQPPLPPRPTASVASISHRRCSPPLPLSLAVLPPPSQQQPPTPPLCRLSSRCSPEPTAVRAALRERLRPRSSRRHVRGTRQVPGRAARPRTDDSKIRPVGGSRCDPQVLYYNWVVAACT